MLDYLNRVIARINRGGERLPSGVGHLHEFSPWSVPFNPATQAPQLESQDEQINQEENEYRGIRSARPEEPLPPFSQPDNLSSALTPAFRQEIQPGVGRRHLHGDKVGRTGEDSLDGIA